MASHETSRLDVPWWRDPDLRPGLVASLTLSAAVGVFALPFGVAAVSAGATVLQACAISLLVFTGASQFSAVTVVAAGGSTASALGGALLLAARNGVYGLAMSRRLEGSLGRRLLAAQFVIDETTALAVVQPTRRAQNQIFWVTAVAMFGFWNLGTLAGALAGSAIDPQTYGLDVAFPAGFVAMIWPMLSDRRARLAAVIGGAVCLVATPLTPVGVPILLSVLGVSVGIRPTAEPAEVIR